MDHDTLHLMIITRFILSVIIAVGGILAMFLGFYLYRKGTGLKPDGSKVDWGKLKFSLQTVGGVLMATSVGWAVVAQQSFPKLEQSKDGAVSVTINSPGKTPITFSPASIHVAETTLPTTSDTASLEKAFKDALTNSPTAFHVTSGTQDFSGVSVKIDQINNTLKATFENKDARINVIYVPTSASNGVLYIPSSASVEEKPEKQLPPLNIDN